MNKFILISLLLCTKLLCINLLATSLVIIDTEGKHRYQYRNLELLCNSVGFKTDYKNLYDLLENPILNYDAALFLCSPTLLAHPNNPISHYCFDALRIFAQKRNKAIGFMLPAGNSYSPILDQKVLETLTSTHMLANNNTTKLITPLISHFLQPDARHAYLYGTTLLNSKPNALRIFNKQPIAHEGLRALMLPKNCNVSPVAQKTFPLGLLLHNQATDNIILLSKLSMLSFAELDENYFKNPLDLNLRQELLSAAQQTLADFFHATQSHSLEQVKSTPLKLPKELTLKHMLDQKQKSHAFAKLNKKYDWAKDGISCAWLDPNDFFYDNDPTILQKGIKFLFDAKFNLLWFEMIPEWYLCDHGRKKDERDTYIKKTKKLFTALNTYAKTYNKKMPKIFLGLNLSSNFFNHKVKHPVVDIFGRTYSKIPSPIDVANFWQPEVLDIFDTFVQTFGNIVPIDGVFLDFEMYHAQRQGGAFTDIMDFSDFAWQHYTSHNKRAPKQLSHGAKIDYLRKNKLFHNYFKTLTKKATTIGCSIKTHMRKRLPNVLFAAYAPTLPNSWFYRGITRGLSNKKEPLFYATFNTDYYSHYCWLKSQHIYMLHASVVMLSKLTSPDSFKLVDTINNYHDFVWYNRPSRMFVPLSQSERNKKWWAAEASPMAMQDFAAYASKHK